MPFGMKVDIGPGEIVLDRDPVPPPQRGTAANSRPISVVAKWLIDQDATWYGSRPGQGDIVLDGDRAPPKGRINFLPMSIVAKRLNGLRCHLVWR